MSNERDYPNSGIMFRDDKKRDGNERDRDYKGTADITCPDCGSRFTAWLSAWIKLDRKGKFMSLSFKAKDGGGGQESGGARQAEEDIPF